MALFDINPLMKNADNSLETKPVAVTAGPHTVSASFVVKNDGPIVTSVAKGNRVTVVGFGTFLPRKRKARAGRSPTNGKEIKINAKTVPAFAAGQGFKDAVGDR